MRINKICYMAMIRLIIKKYNVDIVIFDYISILNNILQIDIYNSLLIYILYFLIIHDLM